MTNWTWWTAEECGDFLGVVARHFRERIAIREDFPQPLRVGGTGNPRWRSDEVMTWSQRERERQAGKKRQSSRVAMSDADSR